MTRILPRFLMSVLLMSVFLALAARPAAALPEIYGGLGVRSYALPGSDSAAYAGTLEAGVDAIFSDIGAGLRVDTPQWKPAVAVQLRYSVLKVPFARIFAGIGGGVERARVDSNALSWNGTFEVFAGARVSMGLPYLGLNVGGAKSHYGDNGFQLFSTLTVGLAL